MPIHIGKIVQAEVESQRLTYKEFGALINRNEKTVPDIYDRPTMATDLLVTISIALKKDFLKLYYEEEGMKALRTDEITEFNTEIQRLKDKILLLEKDVKLYHELYEANKRSVSLLTDKVEEYKRKGTDPGNTSSNEP